MRNKGLSEDKQLLYPRTENDEKLSNLEYIWDGLNVISVHLLAATKVCFKTTKKEAQRIEIQM